MSYFFIIITFIVIILLQSRKVDKLQQEVLRLKSELKKYKNLVSTSSVEKSANIESTILQQNVNINTKVVKQNINSESNKNLTILIAGSILIVLAAIVFLTSAWAFFPNIVKTLVLFLFAGVFLEASKISKEKFHLEKASQTFFYIAMAYLPICLLSISIFGLLGEFLSITGMGRYLYLGTSTIILSIIYFIVSKTESKKYLIYGSLLSQIFSVILFTFMFEERIFLVFINLLLYNLLLMLLTKQKVFKDVYKAIPLIIGVITLFGLYQTTIYTILTCILLVINFATLYYKDNNLINSFGINFYLLAFGLSIIFKRELNFSADTVQLFSVLYVSIVFILENLLLSSFSKKENLAFSLRILTMFSMIALYTNGAYLSDPTIPNFIYGIIFTLLTLYCFKASKSPIYKYIAYSFLNILLLDINHDIFNDSSLKQYIPMLVSTIIMYFEKMYPTLNDDGTNIYLCAIESIALISVGFIHTEVSALLCIIFTIAVIAFNYTSNISEYFNISPMLCVLPSILDGGLSSEFEIVVLLISSMALTLLSLSKQKINIYTIFSGIYFVLTCYEIDNNYLTNLILIAWAVAHIYFLINDKEKDIFRVITYILSSFLYYLICEELEITNYTIFKMLGAIISGMLIIKTVLNKYCNTDNLEYLFWFFIYIIAISNYNDSIDGILFSFLIIATIFYSYNKKYGATFLSGILAIIANAFLLTRYFWLIIPWWIYLLGIGGSLIAFAIKNEASENKISIGSVLKNIKDNCENK